MSLSHQLHSLADGRFMEVYRLEELADTGVFDNYQRYDFYQLLWFTRVGGDASYMLDFEEHRLHNDQLFLIFPGQIDKLDVAGKLGYIFVVSKESFLRINQRMQCDFLNGYYGNVIVTLEAKVKRALLLLLELVFAEYNAECRQPLLENYMEAIFYHISSYHRETQPNSGKCDTVIAQLMQLIDEYYIVHRETEFYAELLGMTHKKLNEVVIKGTGRSVKQHLQDRLVLEIKKEIRLNEKNLKEIAYSLGFNEPGYFTRFFKQHTGVTPRAFRG